jgi:hypothetical protein
MTVVRLAKGQSRIALGCVLYSLAVVGTLTIGCSPAPNTQASSASSAVTVGSTLPSSATAAAVVAQAQSFRFQLPPIRLRHFPKDLPTDPPVLKTSDVSQLMVSTSGVYPTFPKGTPKANITFPLQASGTRSVVVGKSKATIKIALQGASGAAAEFANGYVVYRGGLAAGGDMIVRPSLNGHEDYFLFGAKPTDESVAYQLTMPAGAGLRLTNNILELIGSNGTPLMHLSPPFLVDSNKTITKASLSVSGCSVDTSPKLPWKREPQAPGASTCLVTVSWKSAAVAYPALLDLILPRFDGHPVRGENASRSGHGEAAAEDVHGRVQGADG